MVPSHQASPINFGRAAIVERGDPMSGSLVRDTPHSEVTATLEVLAARGVERTDLARLRSEPELTTRVALALRPAPEPTEAMEMVDYPNETFGQRLKRLRIAAGLSQRQLAVPGCSAAFISRLEADDRVITMKTLRLIAPKLGVPAEYIETGKRPTLAGMIEQLTPYLGPDQRIVIVDAHLYDPPQIDVVEVFENSYAYPFYTENALYVTFGNVYVCGCVIGKHYCAEHQRLFTPAYEALAETADFDVAVARLLEHLAPQKILWCGSCNVSQVGAESPVASARS